MEKNQKGLLKDSNFTGKLIRLMLPIMLQNLMVASVAAGDAVMLGRLAQDSMTAVSMATQIQFIQNMFISSIVGATSALGAQYWGKRDEKAINEIFCMALRIAGIISVAFATACLIAPEYLMIFFTDSPELIRIGAGYLRIAGLSYLLTGFSQCYQTIMKITDHVISVAAVSSIAVILNICLNAVFIFGIGPFPSMGANGAALATLVARIVEFAICIILSFKKGYIKPKLRALIKRNKVLAKDFNLIALPLLGGALLWGVGFTSYTAIIGHMGTDAAAANAIASVVRDLVCCACNGVGSATGIIVGNELGAGNLELGKIYGIKLAKISFIIGFASMALVLVLTFPIANFMILTDKARKYLIGMMVIMAIYMIGRCVNTVIINGIFDGGGDTLFDMYSLAVTMWCLAIPLACLGAFVFHWHVFLVYSCTCLDEVGKIPWVLIHFKKYKWVKNLTR